MPGGAIWSFGRKAIILSGMVPTEPTSKIRQLAAELIQFAIAVFGAFIGYRWALPSPDNPKVPLAAALISGFGLWYVTMKIYVWIRFGRAAAKSMSVDP
jgi:hypothetical protein